MSTRVSLSRAGPARASTTSPPRSARSSGGWGRARRSRSGRAAADLILGILQRTHRLERTLREGAANDRVMAELLAQAESNWRTDDRLGMELVLRRPVTDVEVDLFWVQTGPETYDALVTRSGRPPERFHAQIVRWIVELGEPR